MIPKFNWKIFEDGSYSILSAAEGEGEDDDLFFKFSEDGANFFDEVAILVINWNWLC